MTGSELDQATLERFDRESEVDMRTPRRDGSESSRPIWVVVVDGSAYVRSYQAERGAWYRRALADGRARIAVGDTIVGVGLEPDTTRMSTAASPRRSRPSTAIGHRIPRRR